MSDLWKKEVLIRENSTITIADALVWTEKWLESFYVGKKTLALPDDLKFMQDFFGSKGNANYDDSLRGTTQLDDYFADVFDSRVKPTPLEWRVYHSACRLSRGMSTLIYLKTPVVENLTPVDNELNQTNEQSDAKERAIVLPSPVVLDAVVVDVG